MRTLTPNEIAAWNLRKLRRQAGLTQERLAEIMRHFGVEWTPFTVSDAELAVDRGDRGRRFAADELAMLAMILYVTPTTLLVPPSPDDLTVEDGELLITVGDVAMTREAYLTDVLLMPSGVGGRRFDGAIEAVAGEAPRQ